MPPLLIFLAIGVGVAALLAFVALLLFPNAEASYAEERLETLVSARGRGRGASPGPASLLLTGGHDDGRSAFDRWAASLPQLRPYLQQAGVELSPAKFVWLTLAAFAAGSASVAATPLPVLLAPLAGLLLASLPLLWVLQKRKLRLAKFGRQLPEALELLSRSLRAGHSLAAGFGLVGSEMQEPLSREFQRVFEEQNFGISIDEALEDLAARVPNLDLRFFATAVILQRTTGGDLAEILEKIGYLIRERLQILGQVNALTGEGRLSGIVLLAMPPALFLFMLKLNPEYVLLLFQDSIGQWMLTGAVVMQIIGALVIKKIITIKV